MSKENITLDELAQIVARGFEKTATKADLEWLATKEEMNQRFEQVNERFNGLEFHISSLGFD